MKNDTSYNQLNGEWFNPPVPRLHVAASIATAKVAAGLQNLCGSRCAGGFGILMYHRVAERFPEIETPSVNVTPGQFRRQLVGLLARGFVAWPLSALVQAHYDSRAIPSNVFAVTFDDGYENNYTRALPVLRELNVPATIFVATKYLNSNRAFPFDSWSAAGTNEVPDDAWRPLTTAQCDEMLDGGLIEIGAHTHSHERFLGRPEDFRHDMTCCLEILRDRFRLDRPTFAFPYGDMNAELVEVARQLGVACCVTTCAERVQPGDDIYQWGRFYVGERDTPAMLAAKLSGWFPALISAGKRLTRPLNTARLSDHCSSDRGKVGNVQRDVPSSRKALSQP